jgi:hypothetical protein
VPNSPAGFKGPLITRDAFNFGDILACKVGVPGAVLVQTTSGANASARVKKIQAIAEAGMWLAAGNRITVHGWSKKGKAGKRKMWECREVEIQNLRPKCEKCHTELTFIRDRGFPDGSGKVWMCANDGCESFALYTYPANT